MRGFIRPWGGARELRVYLGQDAITGKKRYVGRTVRGSRREAKRILAKMVGDADRGAAGAVYDQLLGALRLALRTGLVFALVVALAAWLAGPAKPATRMRESVLRASRGTGTAGGEPSALGTYVARRKGGLRILVVGIGLVVLVALSAPTPAAVITIAVLVLLGILLIEFLGRRATPLPEAPT